jgi:hypothetical protein
MVGYIKFLVAIYSVNSNLKEKIMNQYNITLTPAENLALSYVAFSQDNWIQNAVHERCRIAIEEIVALTVQQCLANNVQIPGSKDEMVELAFAQGWVMAAAQRQAEAEAEVQARQAK